VIPERPPTRRGTFPSTHWTVVLAAGGAGSTTGFSALGEVCRAYWHPLYAFARRLGHSPADAEDLTQGFFAQLLERPFLGRADAAKGRFRSFLLGAFKLYMGKERERAGARKRAGAHPHVSMDIEGLERRIAGELATGVTPETLFERAWAVAILDEAMHRLGAECERAGRLALFREIRPWLDGDPEAGRHAAIAERLGMTEGAVRVTVSRMRRRYLEQLRMVILQTVGSAAEVEDELQYLRRVLHG
jgi:RNA polymerase sigma factor (sigma-70 family)